MENYGLYVLCGAIVIVFIGAAYALIQILAARVIEVDKGDPRLGK